MERKWGKRLGLLAGATVVLLFVVFWISARPEVVLRANGATLKLYAVTIGVPAAFPERNLLKSAWARTKQMIAKVSGRTAKQTGIGTELYVWFSVDQPLGDLPILPVSIYLDDQPHLMTVRSPKDPRIVGAGWLQCPTEPPTLRFSVKNASLPGIPLSFGTDSSTSESTLVGAFEVRNPNFQRKARGD